MTQDSGDQETNKVDAVEGAQAAPKARRRTAAITMLMGDSPQLKIVRKLLQIRKDELDKSSNVTKTPASAPLPGVEKPQSVRRVSRTLLDVDQLSNDPLEVEGPEIESESGSRPKIARTLHEADLPSVDQLQVDRVEVAEENAEAETVSTPRVPKTLLETDLPSIDQLPVDQVEVAEEKADEADLVSEPRVAKTLLEVDLPSIDEPLTDQVHVAEEKADAETVSKPRVAKTVLEADLPLIEQLVMDQIEVADRRTDAESFLQPQPEQFGRVQHFVAKTLLDSDVLAAALQKFHVRKSEIAEEEAKYRASLPAVEFHPVESKKLVRRCPWRWDDESSTERALYCPNCRTQVYNFEGLELPEAEELVFVRENKRNATLYKRPDGKFMTQDCPVEVNRRRTVVFLSIVGGTLVIVLLASLIVMPPRLPSPPPPAATEAELGTAAKKQGGAFSSATKKPVVGAGQGAPHTGTRKRPTFTPNDKKSYWE